MILVTQAIEGKRHVNEQTWDKEARNRRDSSSHDMDHGSFVSHASSSDAGSVLAQPHRNLDLAWIWWRTRRLTCYVVLLTVLTYIYLICRPDRVHSASNCNMGGLLEPCVCLADLIRRRFQKACSDVVWRSPTSSCTGHY